MRTSDSLVGAVFDHVREQLLDREVDRRTGAARSIPWRANASAVNAKISGSESNCRVERPVGWRRRLALHEHHGHVVFLRRAAGERVDGCEAARASRSPALSSQCSRDDRPRRAPRRTARRRDRDIRRSRRRAASGCRPAASSSVTGRRQLRKRHRAQREARRPVARARAARRAVSEGSAPGRRCGSAIGASRDRAGRRRR